MDTTHSESVDHEGHGEQANEDHSPEEHDSSIMSKEDKPRLFGGDPYENLIHEIQMAFNKKAQYVFLNCFNTSALTYISFALLVNGIASVEIFIVGLHP